MAQDPPFHTFPAFPGQGYMKIDDLAEYLGMTPSDVFRNYLPLSYKADEAQFFEVTDGKRLHTIPFHLLIESPTTFPFVGLGWATNVIRAFQRGYVKVVLERHIVLNPYDDKALKREWLSVHGLTEEKENEHWVAVGYKA